MPVTLAGALGFWDLVDLEFLGVGARGFELGAWRRVLGSGALRLQAVELGSCMVSGFRVYIGGFKALGST